MTWADGTDPITNDADMIDSREIIARIEHLEELTACVVCTEPLKPTGDTLEPVHEHGDTHCGTGDGAVATGGLDEAELEELEELRKVAEQASNAADWLYGEALIRETYFTDYIRELVNDCYEVPAGFGSGEWPWRHMSMDWDEAAHEARTDYFDVDFNGITYWVR